MRSDVGHEVQGSTLARNAHLETVDVAIVGAGMAGLGCARQLSRAGLTCVVLEARDRVGGRILTMRAPSHDPVELGAQVIHGDQASIWGILGEVGLRTAPLGHTDEFVFCVGDQMFTMDDTIASRVVAPWIVEQQLYQGSIPDLPAATLVNALGLAVDSEAIALEWLAQIWRADPAKLSPAGMREIKHGWISGTGEFVVIDGYDRLPIALADGLDIRLRSPVRQVKWGTGWIEMETNDRWLKARAAVITVSPAIVGSGAIQFSPTLPQAKIDAAHNISVGDAIVISAQLSVSAPQSTWALVVGGGFWRTEAGSRHVGGWIKGPSARNVRGRRSGASCVVDIAGRSFPWLRADHVEQVRVTDWGKDRFALGAQSYPGMGTGKQPGVWAAPIEQELFFAGEASCSDRHPATVHGAFESGLRAAGEVINALAS